MEARLEAVSPARLWWNKIGKWQALMVMFTLGVFFVTLGITGDAKDAFPVAAAFAVAFAVVAVVAVVAAFAAAIAATAVAATAVVAFAAVTTATTAAVAFAVVTTATTAAVVFAVVAVVAAVAADEIRGISRKVVWLSYTGEFLLILLPLWVMR